MRLRHLTMLLLIGNLYGMAPVSAMTNATSAPQKPESKAGQAPSPNPPASAAAGRANEPGKARSPTGPGNSTPSRN